MLIYAEILINQFVVHLSQHCLVNYYLSKTVAIMEKKKATI